MLLITGILLGLASVGSANGQKRVIEERQTAPGNPCEALSADSKNTFWSPQTVMACLQTIPFKPEVRANILGVADKAFSQLDIFASNKQGDSAGPGGSGRDIQEELALINTKNFTSDFEFHNYLTRSLESFNDGYHAWSSCYTTLFNTTHAIPIVALSASPGSNETNVHIVPDVASFVAQAGFAELYAKAGIDASSLAGAQVLSIDGRSAWDYLEKTKLAAVGSYPDRQQRLNSLFASNAAEGGKWSRIPGRFTLTNDWSRNNITLAVRTKTGAEQVVIIPWVVRYKGPAPWAYATGEAFWTERCGVPHSQTARQLAVRDIPVNAASPSSADIDRVIADAYQKCPIVSDLSRGVPVPAEQDPTKSPAYLGGRDVMFFVIPNTKVGVIYFSTFAPKPTFVCNNRYIADFVSGLRNFTTAGVENILIDTSNNEDGSFALSQLFQVYLLGRPYLGQAGFQSVFRRSPLSEAYVPFQAKLMIRLVQRFIDNPSIKDGFYTFRPTNYRVGGTPLTLRDNYFSPGREYQINNQTIRTSNLLGEDLGAMNSTDKIFPFPDTAAYPPQSIVITGNGLCGSACASFSAFLVEYHNTTGYIQSAQPSKPIGFTAPLIGELGDTDRLYAEATAIGFNDTALLPRLTSGGWFNFAIRASLSPKRSSGQFLDLVPSPAAKRYAMTEEMYLNPMAAWTYVASQAFPKAGAGAGSVSGASQSGGERIIGAGMSEWMSMAMGLVVLLAVGV